jgi:hypothetical protein
MPHSHTGMEQDAILKKLPSMTEKVSPQAALAYQTHAYHTKVILHVLNKTFNRSDNTHLSISYDHKNMISPT